jgi:hypothetical protein
MIIACILKLEAGSTSPTFILLTLLIVMVGKGSAARTWGSGGGVRFLIYSMLEVERMKEGVLWEWAARYREYNILCHNGRANGSGNEWESATKG